MGNKKKGHHDIKDNRNRDPWEGSSPTAEKGKKKKLSKKERKELLKQQQENEKRLVAEGVISARVRYTPRSFLGSILALCLAFFLGIFFAVGAVILAGAKFSIKTITNMVGIDSSALVMEEYANQSLLNLFYDIKSTQFVNLNSLGKFTPLLQNSMQGLSEQLTALGVELDVSELMEVNFGELGSYFQGVIQTIELGSTLNLTPDSSALMIAICYGEEDVDFEIVDGEFKMLGDRTPTTIADLANDAEDLLGKVTVEAALNITARSAHAMRYLAYG
ncbi:MAG: hypothetical protein K2N74_05795, partial [Clostridiales bacterium]|nr:hypothetical protein [Clostridiales bacterium]